MVTMKKRALIATDVDRTILTQTKGQEKQIFSRGIGHELINLIENGFYVAFITGNSMEQLTSRLLRFLVEELCHTGRLGMIGNFHFFSNAGGVYFHFDENNAKIKELIEKHEQQDLIQKVMEILTSVAKDGSLSVRPEFIDTSYLKRTRISEEDVQAVRKILEEQAKAYYSEIDKNQVELEKVYNLTDPTIAKDDGSLINPKVEERPIRYMNNNKLQMDTVQLTLKPILSYKHGIDQISLFEKDHRTYLVKKIQDQLDEKGLAHYIARPGGKTSIDVTLAKLDKAYALEFIIDRLNLQGQERLGEHIGSNTIYFGDEVIVGGGNDYPVTRIPGLLTFAVNHNYTTIPVLSHVLVPSLVTHEVGATLEVLRKLNNVVTNMSDHDDSVLDVFKRKLFKKRVLEKIHTKTNLKADNWQTLNCLVSLMCRKDESAKRWLEILVEELDSIMLHLGDRSHQSAYGTSHPDA